MSIYGISIAIIMIPATTNAFKYFKNKIIESQWSIVCQQNLTPDPSIPVAIIACSY